MAFEAASSHENLTKNSLGESTLTQIQENFQRTWQLPTFSQWQHHTEGRQVGENGPSPRSTGHTSGVSSHSPRSTRKRKRRPATTTSGAFREPAPSPSGPSQESNTKQANQQVVCIMAFMETNHKLLARRRPPNPTNKSNSRPKNHRAKRQRTEKGKKTPDTEPPPKEPPPKEPPPKTTPRATLPSSSVPLTPATDKSVAAQLDIRSLLESWDNLNRVTITQGGPDKDRPHNLLE